MALAYLRHKLRSPWRVRLQFSHALGSGAFDPSWYSLACTDSLGADPTVVEAMVVPTVPDSVELVLDLELAPGAAYEITILAGVPGATEPPLPADASGRFVQPRPQPPVAQEVAAEDPEALVYGQDLRHEGGDFVEGADGDLAIVSGVRNAVMGVQRIAEGDGLPWAGDWGAKLRQFVDAPSPSLGVARGRTVQAVLVDDRIRSADATATVLEGDESGDVRIDLVVDLIGGQREDVSARVGR